MKSETAVLFVLYTCHDRVTGFQLLFDYHQEGSVWEGTCSSQSKLPKSPKRWPREGWQPTYRQTAKTQLWVLTALCNLFSPECQLAWCFAANQQVMMRWYHPSIRLPNTVTFLHSHILYCPLGLLQAVLRIYLFERKSYKDTWRDGERSSSCWLTPQIAVMVKAGLGRSQEFQFECLTHAQRPKPLGHVLCLIIP